MLWLMLFIVFNIINSAMISSLGCSVDSVEYWVGIICVCGAYVAGKGSGYFSS